MALLQATSLLESFPVQEGLIRGLYFRKAELTMLAITPAN